jgi:hypothetical protein
MKATMPVRVATMPVTVTKNKIEKSIESHVGNHLVADVFVKAADDVLTLHGEFHAEGGIGEVDEERLVADVEGSGVRGNSLAHDLGPGIDEALLKERRL